MPSPQQAMRTLLREDPRFKIEAYAFVRDALQFAHEHADLIGHDTPAETSDEGRHLTGQQLCEACRLYAIGQYGYLAKIVLNKWGLHSTSDLGDVVYNLIGIEQMRKSNTDRREDFNDVYEFGDAFEPQFELAARES